jgi:folate-binding protein YgfZ
MVGEKAFDYYRVINKVPKKPNEINDNFNPHEAGLIHEVSFTKGCYIGQEVIARLHTYDKVQKNIKKVRIENIEETATPVELFNEEKALVGILTTLVKAEEK